MAIPEGKGREPRPCPWTMCCGCRMLDLSGVEIKLNEEGFVLPFTVDEDVHKRVALCIDGPKRFCFNSKNLLEKEASKHRHHRLLNYQVVQIPYHEVEVLKSRLELVEYLQRKLFPKMVGFSGNKKE